MNVQGVNDRVKNMLNTKEIIN